MIQRDPTVGDVALIEIIRQASSGYTVRLSSGTLAFLPLSEISWNRSKSVRNERLIEGQTGHAKIVDIIPKKHGTGQWIQVSIRALIPNPWEHVEALYPEGCRVQATISGFSQFGAILSLPGGVTLLVHDSEISWTDRDASARQHLTVGQIIEVIVIESSNEHRKLIGSYRRTFSDPWTMLPDSLCPGASITGTITTVVDYGAFILLECGVTALLHKNNITDFTQLGEGIKITATVLSIDISGRRIALAQGAAGR